MRCFGFHLRTWAHLEFSALDFYLILKSYYKLQSRLCINGSKQVQGIDFEVSFAPVADAMSIRTMICTAAHFNMTGSVIDISNAFQTNVVEDFSQRRYVSLPPYYMNWLQHRWPDHHALKFQAK